MSDASDKNELLPCPCCKSRNLNRFTTSRFLSDTVVNTEIAQCLGCGCEAPLTAWNTRPSSKQEALEALEAVLRLWEEATRFHNINDEGDKKRYDAATEDYHLIEKTLQSALQNSPRTSYDAAVALRTEPGAPGEPEDAQDGATNKNLQSALGGDDDLVIIDLDENDNPKVRKAQPVGDVKEVLEKLIDLKLSGRGLAKNTEKLEAEILEMAKAIRQALSCEQPQVDWDAFRVSATKHIEECHARYDKPCLENVVNDCIDHLKSTTQKGKNHE